jgi:diguanylate cyclase (GGDEF)-like protein
MNSWELEILKQRIEFYKSENVESCLALSDLDFFANISEKIGPSLTESTICNIVTFFFSYWKQQNDKFEFFRYGDDEFALLLPEVKLLQAKEAFDKFKKSFRRQKFIGGETVYAGVPITISIGLTDLCRECDAQTFLKMTESALAMAKKLGRSRVEVSYGEVPYIITKGTVAVSTFMGAGLSGCCQDNEKAAKAAISQPYGITTDNDGSLLLTDRGNHRILRIKNGIVRTVAGTGVSGFDADGLPAHRSRLCKPSGVAVTPTGELIIADTGNNRIRAVDKNGILKTIVGGSIPGYDGDGNSASRCLLSRPGGVVTDSNGNIFTNDYGNNVIRRISANGIIETVVGSGEFGYCKEGSAVRLAALDKPYGLAVSSNGTKIYIADYGSNRVLLANLSENKIITLCGCGEQGYSGDGEAGRLSRLNGPYWITNCEDNVLFIVDAGNHCIREYNLHTGIIRTVAGRGSGGYKDTVQNPLDAKFNIPAGLAFCKQEHAIYIADYANNAIRKVNL